MVASLIGAVALVYVVGYGLLAARRVFADSWLKTLAKAAAVSVAYMLCFFVMSLAMLAFALARM